MSKAKGRTFYVSDDLWDNLIDLQNKIEGETGIKPSISALISAAIKKFVKER